MSINFDFTFGRPLDEGAGRWVHGSVVGTASAFSLWPETDGACSDKQIVNADVHSVFGES